MTNELIALGLIDEDDIMLDKAALALATLDHPDVDTTPYHRLLAAIDVRLQAIGGDATDAGEHAAALARVLAVDFGFAGDDATYDDPANADLMEVIDRRRGLPVSLAILYVAAARRQGWAANVLDLPGHVLVLVGQDVDPVIIDPFHHGARVAPYGLLAMLDAPEAATSAARHVATMPNRAVLARLLLNQATRADKAGDGSRALELYRRITTIAPGLPPPWWERARLELADGDVTTARASLGAILEVSREPRLRRRVNDTLKALAQA